MPSLTAWIGNQTTAREADTLKERDADPTVVTVRRAGAALPDTLTVRFVVGVGNRQAGLVQRGAASQEATGGVTVLAAAGTDIRRGDLLIAGSAVYRVTWVFPGQEWRLEAAAEVVE